MKQKGFDIFYASLYPQSCLRRIIANFKHWGLQNWRFVFYDMRNNEKQYYLCAKTQG